MIAQVVVANGHASLDGRAGVLPARKRGVGIG